MATRDLGASPTGSRVRRRADAAAGPPPAPCSAASGQWHGARRPHAAPSAAYLARCSTRILFSVIAFLA